jgi:hypothetical protein
MGLALLKLNLCGWRHKYLKRRSESSTRECFKAGCSICSTPKMAMRCGKLYMHGWKQAELQLHPKIFAGLAGPLETLVLQLIEF